MFFLFIVITLTNFVDKLEENIFFLIVETKEEFRIEQGFTIKLKYDWGKIGKGGIASIDDPYISLLQYDEIGRINVFEKSLFLWE